MATTGSSHCFKNSYAFDIEELSFDRVPGQSRLFVDYQTRPLDLVEFYPEAVGSHLNVSSRIERVLEAHKVDRTALCDALEGINREIGAGPKTLENIALLREADCVAVVSGQQAGLFGGPLYTLYKALSAARLAKCLMDRGFKAVPVFWIASEDHDFDEVSQTFVTGKTGELVRIENRPAESRGRLPVGEVKLDATIKDSITKLFSALPHTEHTVELRELIESAWSEGEAYGHAFAKLTAYMLQDYGIVFLCPLDPRLKELAGPLYAEAVGRSASIVEALKTRSTKLEEAGYHAQVHVGEDYFPLFWQDDSGSRTALRRVDDGGIVTKDLSHRFTPEELIKLAEESPARLSPSVVLRSVVQDYLLPTVAYFGGAAEVAYFAQSAEVYRVLGRPVTSIIHRQSLTIIEPRHSKTLERYGLGLKDLFRGFESLLPEIVESYLNSDAGRVFEGVESAIESELDRLHEALRGVDPTLTDNLSKRRRKIAYHLEALRHKFHAAQLRKDSDTRARIESMFSALLPNRGLQERSLNACYFVNRYGRTFVDWIYEAIDLDDPNHRILHL